MRVPVKEPVLEDHRHPRLAHPVREVPPLFERVRFELDVGDLDAFEKLERQHALSRVAPVDPRNLNVWIARPVAAEALGVAPFRAIVQLGADRAAELVDQVTCVDEVERTDPFLRDARGLVEQREVGLDLPRGARTLHLDRDRLAVRQRRSMYLPDRGCSDRYGIELEKRTFQRKAEVALDDLLDLLERERPHVVLQRAQLDDDVGRNDVGTRREELAELHERRAELVEHLAQVDAPLVRGDGLARRALTPWEEIGQLVLLEEVPEAVAHCDLRDLGQPPEVPLRRPCRHGVSVTRRGVVTFSRGCASGAARPRRSQSDADADPQGNQAMRAPQARAPSASGAKRGTNRAGRSRLARPASAGAPAGRRAARAPRTPRGGRARARATFPESPRLRVP